MTPFSIQSGFTLEQAFQRDHPDPLKVTAVWDDEDDDDDNIAVVAKIQPSTQWHLDWAPFADKAAFGPSIMACHFVLW